MQQQYRNQDSQQPARSEPQDHHHGNIAFAVITHVIRMAVSLAPLAILELQPNPTRATRLIKAVSIIGTGANEMLWATKVAMHKEHDRHR
jgi:hypothetical protein